MDLAKEQKIVEQIESLLRDGYDLKTLKRDYKVSDEILSMARARIKNARENKIDQNLMFTEDDLRFCTNQMVANYRAKRLACSTIIDIGCGIGIQAIAFAKTCKKVIAIDIDQNRLERAKINAKIAGAHNIDFVHDDALKVLGSIKTADIIFWDPERPAAEIQRSIKSLLPSFEDVMTQSQRLTAKIAIELPPRLNPQEIPRDPELEYIVMGHETNRLTAYFGPLKKVQRTVITVPEQEKISSDDPQAELAQTTRIREFLAEIDEAVLGADLLGVIAAQYPQAEKITVENKLYLTADHKMNHPLLRLYKVQTIAKQAQLQQQLKKAQCEKVLLHGKIPPRAYASWRKSLQSHGKGGKTCHLFVIGDEYAITHKE